MFKPLVVLEAILRRYGSDKLYLKVWYRNRMGYWMDFKNPETFTEKMQWLKLYNRKPIYTTMVDKYAVKKYVGKIIGMEYIIPTIGVWNSFEEIDFDSLPKKFVIKCTHDSGGLIICTDKSSLNINNAKAKIATSLQTDFYSLGREWPYKNVPRKIIAEQYMEDNNSYQNNSVNDLVDYKFYCFNGEPAYCQVIRNRNICETIDFYDMSWNHMPFCGLNPKASNGNTPVEKPNCFNKMLSIVRKLSNGIPFSRIDLYLIDSRIFFGEITFFPGSGIGMFTPNNWNKKLGDMIDLPI